MVYKMIKNTLLERQGRTKKSWVSLFVVVFSMIFLIGIVSATLDVVVLSGQTDSQSRTQPIGVVFTPLVNGIDIIGQKYPLTDADTMELWFRTGNGAGVNLRNATFDMNGNATILRGADFNTSSDYFLTVASSIGGSFNNGRNTSATGNYPRSSSQITVTSSVLVTVAEYTDQAETFAKIYTTNGSSPSVSLISPANGITVLDSTNFFVANVTQGAGDTLQSVSLYINGTLNQTNVSGLSGVYYNFTTQLPFGFWNWSIVATGNNGQITTSATRNITIANAVFITNAYNPFVLETTTQTFYTNFTLATGLTLSAVNFTYNQTNYSASFTQINGTSYNATVSLLTPSVTTNTNISFNWTLFLSDSSVVKSANYQQQVQDFGIDNCGSNTLMIMNLTMKDEDNQNTLNGVGQNTTIKINLNLYPNGTKTVPTATFSALYNQTNPARVCISSALGSSIFYIDSQIEYTASNYADEFYNIQNYSLNATSNPSQNMSLYDLISGRDQVFLVTYRDSNFLPVAGALIQVGRLYVDEGLTKTVEVPITDTLGSTVANLVLNSVVYTFTVTKNGQVLAIFTNNLAKCQNPSITTCEIDLNSFSSSFAVTNFTKEADFLYTLTYDKSIRLVSSTFSIPSGGVSNITLNVTGADAVSTFLCSQSVVTSSGTISCTIPASFGNQTAYATLYRDGVQVAYGQVSNAQNPKNVFAGLQVFLGLIAILTLIGAGVSDNPVYTGIWLVIGFGTMISLDLVASNGFIGAGATILFLVVGVWLLIVKGGKRT